MKNNMSPGQMREFIDHLDGLAVLDKDGYYTYVSPGWEEYSGCPAEKAIGRTVWDIFPETHATEVFETGKSLSYGLVLKKGTPAFTTYYPRFDSKGNVCGIYLYIVLRSGSSPEELSSHVQALSKQVEYYEKELALERGAKYTLDSIVGESAAIRELKEQIKLAARSSSTVLIEGETGSGKELIAHSIHTLSKRRKANFVRVNCAAIPAELMESEFFGYAAGAFTDASKKGKIGRFALANGGSIFLDEINLLPMTMQPKFLRVLQEKEIDPVGATQSIAVDTRVIAACNVDLEKMVEAGDFRQDLYYRLNVVRLKAPSLRERPEDIPTLVNIFIRQYNRTLGMMVERISDEALAMLLEYEWPGNVRELQNSIESAMNHATDSILQKKHFGPLVERIRVNRGRIAGRDKGGYNLAREKRAFEKRLIQDALQESKGNRKEAAELLGISRTMLYKKLDQYNMNE